MGFLAFGVLVILVVGTGLIFLQKLEAARNTPLARIERTKIRIKNNIIEKWKTTRGLGSKVTAQSWLRCELPQLEPNWFKGLEHLTDEQLIKAGVDRFLSMPAVIDHLVECERDERLAEMNAPRD